MEQVSRSSVWGEPAQVRYRGVVRQVRRGITVAELMELFPGPIDDTVIAALVNNRLVSLDARIARSGTVEPVPIASQLGGRLYQRHLTIMLYEVFGRLYPGCRIHIGQSISEGHYFKVTGTAVNDAFLRALADGMRELAAAREPFVYERVPVEEARRLFSKRGETFKHRLLDQWADSHVAVVHLRDFTDFCFSPVAPHTGYFSEFALLPLEEDVFILQFPDHHPPHLRRNNGPQPKLYATHKEAKRWSALLGIAYVAELNAVAITKRIKEVIQVAEGLHEKKLASIADSIARPGGPRLVFIAGPSSAGKTTFTKRLAIQLKASGIHPTSLSLDNYYVNRADTPLDAQGKPDFEALEAIDLERLNQDLGALLAGEQIRSPVYDFQSGKRAPKERWIPMRLGPDDVLLIEGIHGLNDALTPRIDAADKFRIYVNALNPLAIDPHNRLNTSDVRLIRRIVRDRHYRGYSAAQTIAQWPSVRRGERNHIFPHQERADVIFDTSLIYEFSALKLFAERYLLEVPREDPAFAEAYRLRRFLQLFVPVLPGDIPQNSIIREFIGGSSFSYK